MKTIGALLLASSLVGLGQVHRTADMVGALEGLRAGLTSGAIGPIQIIHVPDSVLTRVAVSESALRAIATTRKLYDADLVVLFDVLFSRQTLRPSDRMPDLRWGILFQRGDGSEVGAVFVDKFGESGFANGDPVAFSSGMFGSDLANQLHKLTNVKD